MKWIKKIKTIPITIMILALFVGVYLVSQNQDTRSQAGTKGSTMSLQQLGTQGGVYALVEWSEAPEVDTLDKPFINGVVVRMYWRDLNPKKGNYNWSFIDTQLNRAKKNGKKVRFMIAPGFYSPNWVLRDKNIATATFTVPQGPDKGQLKPLPLPWDQTYLSYWFEFVDALAKEYKGDPYFSYISAAGPNSHNGEVSLPREADDEKVWLELVNGDTNLLKDKLLQAWYSTIDRFCTDFKGKHFTIAFILKSFPVGRDPNIEQDYIESIARYGAAKCPNAFGIQTNGLDGRPIDPQDALPLPQWQLIADYSNTIFTGFQTRAPHNLYTKENKVSVFRQSILANALSRKPDFIEVYETDVNDPDLTAILTEAYQKLNHIEPTPTPSPTPSPTPTPRPLTWSECIENPNSIITQSYPRVCRTPEGQRVTEPVTPTPRHKR